MREIILDTETTGLDSTKDRIIELAAIRWDGAKFNQRFNPQMKIAPDATRVHGIKDEDVFGEPTFDAAGREFLSFIKDADRLVAHNAEFDIFFLMAEYARFDITFMLCGKFEIVDTLALANKKFPNGRNSLDALCNKFDISKKRRKLHGALLDCELLKEVYDRLLHGDVQGGFDLVTTAELTAREAAPPDYSNRPTRKSLLTDGEMMAWTQFIATINKPIWPIHNHRKAA